MQTDLCCWDARPGRLNGCRNVQAMSDWDDINSKGTALRRVDGDGDEDAFVFRGLPVCPRRDFEA